MKCFFCFFPFSSYVGFVPVSNIFSSDWRCNFSSQFWPKNSTIEKKHNSVRDLLSSHSGRKPFHFSSNVFCWTKTFFLSFFLSPQTIFPKQNKYPVLTLLMTILHNSSQDEMIPGRGGGRRTTEAVDALDCGDGRGNRWQEDNDDDAGVGVSIGIGIAPDSGGDNGDCMSSFQQGDMVMRVLGVRRQRMMNHDTVVSSNGFVRHWKQQSTNEVGKREGRW